MPCRIYPKLTEEMLSALPSQAETKFYRSCFKQLPSNFLVLHSVSLINPLKSGGHTLGESDFVIFDPNKGILVVEVKGGGIDHNPSNGPEWYSIDKNSTRHEIKNPFEQVKKNQFSILTLIKNNVRGLKDTYFPISHSVVFPDISTSQLGGIIGLNRPKEIIACKEDLNDLNQWYEKSFSYWNGKKTIEPLGKQALQEIEKVFLKPVLARPTLASKLSEEENKRIQLTNDQARLLISLQNHNRANIIGGAGTGKTVLAKKLTEDFNSQEKRTALICFNRSLGDILNLDFKNRENIYAGAYHNFFINLLGIKIGNDNDPFLKQANEAYPNEDFWNVQLPFAFSLAIDENPKLKFDAVIIDEAQDMTAEMWMPLELLLKNDHSKFFIFSDTNQSLYSKIDHIPKLSPDFLLYSNCRNTKMIHDEAYLNYTGPPISPPPIEGRPIKKSSSKMLSEQTSEIFEIIDDLVKDNDIETHKIVILVANSEDYSHCLELLESNKKHSFSQSETDISEKIRISTIKRFKGLEASVIILWGLDNVHETERLELSYVGISRAKSFCYLIG